MKAWEILTLGAVIIAAMALGAALIALAFIVAKRYHDTGQLMPDREDRDSRRIGNSPEMSAHRNITESEIEVGMKNLEAAYREAGRSVPSKAKLRAEAEQMAAGGHPMGGVT